VDLAARIQLFEREIDEKKHYYAFGRYYLPELAVAESNNSQYEGWVRENRIETTEGNIIDFDVIQDEAEDLVSRFPVREVAYDPFQATQFSTQMAVKGFTMVEMRPTVLNFSEPMKELEALVIDGRFHHDGDPILGWAVSNVVCHYDKKDNIYPTKEKPENKIDPLVALLMALGRVITAPITTRSVYEDEGIFSF
jgi:phage terminase large subunit-like protein